LTRRAGSRNTARSRPGEEARIQPKLLLIAMPDKASCFDRLIDMPNLGLCSIAGNVEDLTNHIRILDLSLHRKNIARIVERELSASDPDVVGLSSMSFQYESAKRIARLCRHRKKGTLVALGGYHATLMYREVADSADGTMFDFLIRGEGERLFHELLLAHKTPSGSFASIKGLSYRAADGFHHNPPAPLADLEQVERRIQKIAKQAKVGDKPSKEELPHLERVRDSLAAGTPARHLAQDPSLSETMLQLSLLTAKPTIYVVNVDESNLRAEGPGLHLLGPGERRYSLARGAATTEGSEVDVLVAPHDALGSPGRAAGVEQVQVVPRARSDVRGAGRRRGQQRLVGLPPHHDVIEQGQLGRDRLDGGRQLGLGDDDPQVGVAEEVVELLGHVAEVHVHGYRPELVGRDHGFDVLGIVEQVQTHVIPRAHAETGEAVRQAVGPGIELGVGRPRHRHAVATYHECLALGHRLGNGLEQIREVELHGAQVRRARMRRWTSAFRSATSRSSARPP